MALPFLFLNCIIKKIQMKSVFFTLLFLFSYSCLKSQIYNSGFENWTNMGSYEVPDQWGTMNHATSHLNIYTVTKWNPGSPGAYFMKITSKAYGMSVLPGIAVYGKLDSTNMQPLSGYSYTQRPAAFTGQWQHMIWGTSQGSVCATLTKWNSSANKRDTVAIAYEELFDMAMSWEAFSVNFNYLSSSNPDSCMIVLKASGDSPTVNDYIWVDDLAFSGSVGVGETSLDHRFNIYPNPASDFLRIDLTNNKSEHVKIELLDVTGRGLLSAEGYRNNFNLDVSHFATGTYFLRLHNGDINEIRKVVIQ